MNGWERKVLGGAKPLLVSERFSLRESNERLEKEGLRRGGASPCRKKDSR